MGDLLKLSDLRKKTDLDNKSGEELLKFIVLCSDSDDSNTTDEYRAFMSAIKALKDSSNITENHSLKMQVHYNRENESLDFKFKFEP